MNKKKSTVKFKFTSINSCNDINFSNNRSNQIS